MKHGIPPNDPGVKNKTITWATVTNWHTQTSDALVKWKSEYEIIYVFITNKTITNIIDPNATNWPENLIVVHKPCLLTYFGPTINQIAILSED